MPRSRRIPEIHYVDDEAVEMTTLAGAELAASMKPSGVPLRFDESENRLFVQDLRLSYKPEEAFFYQYQHHLPAGTHMSAGAHYVPLESRDEAEAIIAGNIPTRVLDAVERGLARHAAIEAGQARLWAKWDAERVEYEATASKERPAGVDPSAWFNAFAWLRDHSGEALPLLYADALAPRMRYDPGSHAQSDSATDRQNERDDAERVLRRLMRWQPTMTPAEREQYEKAGRLK